MIRIVTRGDDAGSAISANKAIRAACAEGVLRNISLMPPTLFMKDAAERLQDLEHVCFGYHCTLSSEWARPRWGSVLPASEVPNLLDETGMFYPSPNALHDAGFPLDEARKEIKAQLQLLRDLKFDVRYMDEHMGLGWLEGLGDFLHELADEEGLIFRPEVQRLKKPEDEVSAEKPLHENFISMINAASEGAYLVVGHPAYNDQEMAQYVKDLNDPSEVGEVAKSRDGQRLLFMHEDVVALFCERDDLQAIRYDEI